MNPAEGLFLYTPIPYFATLVLLLYRHDLSRLRHPFRDGGTPRNRWLVLGSLGLLSPEQASRMPGRRREFVPYVVLLPVSLALSLSWALRVFSPLWYHLIIAQGIAGIVLTASAVRYLGSPPRRSYVDVLRYPRLGSRLRHLPEMLAVNPQIKKLPEQGREKTSKLTKVRRSIIAPFQRLRRRLKR